MTPPAWLRLPAWTLVALGIGVVGWLTLGSALAGERESAAAANFVLLLKTSGKFHERIGVLQNAAQAHLAQAGKHEAAATGHLISADSAQRLAQAAQEALGTAKTAQDSLGRLWQAIGALQASGDALRATVGEQQAALTEVRGAYRAVRIEADSAEVRVTSLEKAGRALVRATECRLISWHPCIRNVHLGPYVGYQAFPKPNTSLGLAVVWSP